MLIRLYIIVLLTIDIFTALRAQSLQFSDPVKLSANINSRAEEVNPFLSPDGNSLYFARAFHKENVGGEYSGMDIWRAERLGKYEWGKITNKLGALNNGQNNAVIGVKSDHRVLYLLNTYTHNQGIAFSKKQGNGWSEPEVIEIPGVGRKEFVGFYMSPDYEVLIISMKGSPTYGEEDLYVSVKNANGHWSRPVNMGATINTSGFEISPFLSSDKKRLYFASNGHGGYGDADIFMSERLYESWTVWSKPVNLGNKINSKGFDAYLNIAEDSTVIFASNREGQLSDLYQCEIIGVEKSSQLALKESLLQEARNILADLRNEGSRREHFIEFEENSYNIPDSQKGKLADIVKDLNYQRYSAINLLSFGGEGEPTAIHDKRVDKIVNYLKLSGINEDKINVTETRRSSNEKPNLAGTSKNGVLVIITNPTN